jgi:hypothetical protein
MLLGYVVELDPLQELQLFLQEMELLLQRQVVLVEFLQSLLF